jgi:hypothetical protein
VNPRQIPIRYGRLAPLFVLLGMSKLSSHLVVDDEQLAVRMSWAFNATIPRASITGAAVEPRRVWWSIGVHGWRGRWLVNGASDGIVWISIDPEVRARVLGVPVRLRTLGVSVDAPDALAALLGTPPEHRAPNPLVP